jgi:hypothetical protein
MSAKKSRKSNKSHKSTQLKPNAFVAKMVKKAEEPPRVRAIRGYIGESNKRGYARIYLDIELRRYVDIPEDGVVHAESISETVMPLGGVYVWVQADAQIFHYGSWAAGEDPTTMATGEEGDPDPTTMATGEEGCGFENPLDLVINPFGRY